MWNMPSVFDCIKRTLPLFSAGSVMALAKHVNPRTNSTVIYADLARTIDGGDGASEEQCKASLLRSCGSNSGQPAVIVGPEDPAYKTPECIAANMKPANIIVKLVRDPSAG
ncbi:hypothetical protein GCG54_00001205 [Colletotrichum gloeosporioides]|uniref:Uncharacterized protein n=1 Tax=Colletotrichum gloeosporioides TaxID=474922 RepID=A0A8H4FE75_COLGL|nr:uncharacterized protein GCG54_00001205 [Colletotrichum gloeosporioides]KAF3799097.1 hypothetical protein GCG54_00001205 [Colletotrichum gloeosporioides]